MQRLWMRVVANTHPLYDIPRGQIGNRFLRIQTDLWKGVRERKWNSEKALIFAPCILRKESGTVFAPDIRALITSKLAMWEAGKICSLVKATEDAARGGTGRRPDVLEEEDLEGFADSVGKRYESMILSGQLRAAVRTITDRGKSGLWRPHDTDNKSGKPVIEVLQSKHPDIRIPDLDGDPDARSAFEPYVYCDEPVPVNCFEDYISCSASALKGAAGLSGVDGETLKGWLVRHRFHSTRLREEMGDWVMWLANESPPYAAYRALNAGRALGGKKPRAPGVRPIERERVVRFGFG